MKYTKFTIKNFKGITDLTIDLEKYPNGKIFPLVGLNESGKTTILEAINFFQENLEDGEEHKIIHKKDSGGFSGEVQVNATLRFNKEDLKRIKNILDKKKFILEKELEEVTIIKKYKFNNNSFETGKDSNSWIFSPDILIKTARASNFTKLYTKDNDLWNEIVADIKDKLPKILYFPDFLFDFPEKIYLENIDTLTSEKEKKVQNQYKKVIDDILHKIDYEKYSINDFLSKIKSTEESQITAKEQIKQQISSILNKEIVTPWEEIFPGVKKSILIDIGNDTTGYFIKLKVQEGTSDFSINERSLGFRWFFGFILFTEFRKAREGEEGEYLFLFDEPASNLHEGSQQKLLTLFEKLTDKAKIIYSTHSPYLISTKTILNAFIVKDEGRKTDDDYNFRQNIKATEYRKFVAENKKEETHFKPILDVLKFKVTDFELTDNIVFFEGKNDYYTFEWILENYFQEKKYNFKLYPGASVDKYENIFREYLAHGKKFIAVFDADGTETTKGKGAKNRYIAEISQELEKQVFTLKDVDSSFDNFTTESIFTDSEKEMIQEKTFSKIEYPNYDKRAFNTAIQEFFIKNEKIELSKETTERFEKIFEFIKTKFNEL